MATATLPEIKECEPAEALKACSTRGALLIDVRTPVEYRAVHAAEAQPHPLDRLDAGPFANLGDKPVYILCKAGGRARQAAEKLATAGIGNLHVVRGGTDAWVAAGLPVVRGKKAMSLERQVRIVAGALVLTGAVLGLTVHVGFVGLSAFVGAGLIFAGITDWCGMGLLLARMPWNR
jgi:rhodanese-related sulfurtransferase